MWGSLPEASEMGLGLLRPSKISAHSCSAAYTRVAAGGVVVAASPVSAGCNAAVNPLFATVGGGAFGAVVVLGRCTDYALLLLTTVPGTTPSSAATTHGTGRAVTGVGSATAVDSGSTSTGTCSSALLLEVVGIPTVNGPLSTGTDPGADKEACVCPPLVLRTAGPCAGWGGGC